MHKGRLTTYKRDRQKIKKMKNTELFVTRWRAKSMPNFTQFNATSRRCREKTRKIAASTSRPNQNIGICPAGIRMPCGHPVGKKIELFCTQEGHIKCSS